MKKGKKLNLTVQIGIIIGIILFAGLLSRTFFVRIDLTDDSRYTLSQVTKDILAELNEQVFVTCYFEGDMPPYYHSLYEGAKTLLQEINTYGHGNIEYQFVNPSGQNEILQRFAGLGYFPFPVLYDLSDTETREVLTMPYIEITYRGQVKVINMIAGSVYRSQQGRLDFDPDKANRELEYKIITTIYNMTRERTKTIGMLTGHGEYKKEAMADLLTELDPLYNIISVDLTQGRSIHPKDVDLLLVLQPQTALREREKYEIDQYLMRGGRIIWCMDQEIVDFAIGEQASTLTDLRNTNLDDLFLKHGVKVNYDLVQDMNCGFIDAATYTTTFGNAMNQKKWVFNPLVYNFSNHPSTRYLNNVLMRLCSSIDTFPTPEIQKTVLMVSSKESRLLSGRQYINVDQTLRQPPDPKKFISGNKNFAVLVEGKFQSLYAGRGIPVDSIVPQRPNEPFTATVQEGTDPKMVIISDGEFAVGELINGELKPLPADNKTLMLNLVDFLSGQEIITKIRVREINRRMLDRAKYKGSERFYQIVNIALPVLLILVFGFVRDYLRRRRNQSFQNRES